MSKTVKCKKCGLNLSPEDKKCPNCGAKTKKNPYLIAFIVFIAFAVIGAGTDTSSSNNRDAAKTAQQQQNVNEKNTNEQKEAPQDTQPRYSNIDPTGFTEMRSDLLYEYGKYMEGKNIITVFTVKEAMSGSIKATTDNNSGLFFSLVCNFKDPSQVAAVSENDVIAVAGTVQEPSPIGSTVTLDNCYLIDPSSLVEKLNAGYEEQKKLGEAYKQAYEAKIAAELKAERDEYISQCQTVKYSDVERNPDNYKDAQIKISGKVIQVSEGLFDSVTLRISSNGNIWYVTYSREENESRILENDYITAYGICKGVKTYTTITGASVTIPSMSMEYYN